MGRSGLWDALVRRAHREVPGQAVDAEQPGADHPVAAASPPAPAAPARRPSPRTCCEVCARHIRCVPSSVLGARSGPARCGAACPADHPRAESNQESCPRLDLVLARLPAPRVVDADGCVIACLDLAYPEAKLAIEHDDRTASGVSPPMCTAARG
jgi:hypothetical protein